MEALFEGDVTSLVLHIDKQYATSVKITDIRSGVSKDDYFTTIESSFAQYFRNGAGDGFSILRFHLIQAGETAEDFTKHCSKNPFLLTLSLFFAVYDGPTKPEGWDHFGQFPPAKVRTPNDKILISLKQLLVLKELDEIESDTCLFIQAIRNDLEIPEKSYLDMLRWVVVSNNSSVISELLAKEKLAFPESFYVELVKEAFWNDKLSIFKQLYIDGNRFLTQEISFDFILDFPIDSFNCLMYLLVEESLSDELKTRLKTELETEPQSKKRDLLLLAI